MNIRKLSVTCLGVCVTVAAVCGIAACVDDNGPGDEPETYSVTYLSGSDDAEGTAPEVRYYEEGEEVTLAAADVFTLSDFEFGGWSCDYDDVTYAAGAKFEMPAADVAFTAVWEGTGPLTNELPADFYDAENWEYMTNDNGASNDGGDIVYALADGSVKFHRVNQAIEVGDYTNSYMSFMLKGTNDWSIWLNSNTLDNAVNDSYRLTYAEGDLRLEVADNSSVARVSVTGSEYIKGEWNRVDLSFKTEGNVTSIQLFINGELATLAAAGNEALGVAVEDNTLVHSRPATFTTGEYFVVKVWNADDYLQLKPVANADIPDVPIIAAVGASITAGANAGNFYTESYPAQLQNMLGGEYNVVNLGNSGKTVTMTPGDGEPWLEQDQWEGFKALVPDYAVVNIGTNDSKPANFTDKDTFKAEYEYFIDQLLSVNSDMHIYICTVPRAYSNSYNITNANIESVIAPVQREVAEEYENCSLIDIYEYSQNKSLLFDDGIHPHSHGYKMFAEIVKAAFEGELDSDFIADIDARYNDKVTDFNATVTASGNSINLVVSGNTTLTDSADITLEVRIDDNTVYTFGGTISDGRFTATADLATLENGYYNVRVYVQDDVYYPEEHTFYHLLLAEDAQLAVGTTFAAGDKQAKVASWKSGWGQTLSFSISAYNSLELTESAIYKEGDKVMLRVSGVTNDMGGDVRLYVGQHPTQSGMQRFYTDIDVATDGAFSATFDLTSIPAGTSNYFNVRIYFSDGSYFAVPLNQTTYNGENVQVGDVFYGTDTQFMVATWSDGGVSVLSLVISEYDSSYTVGVTSVAFEGGNLVVKGNVTNVETLDIYLNNTYVAGSESNFVAATIEGGTFTATLPLDTLIGYGKQNTPFNLRYVADGGSQQKIEQGSLDISSTISYNGYDFRLAVNSGSGCVAVYYEAQPAPSETEVEVTSVAFEGGEFVVSGTAANVETLDIYLINTNVEGSKTNFVTAELGEGGAFAVRLSLDTLISYNVGSNIPFNLRYIANGSGSTVNVGEGALDISITHSYNGYNFRLGLNNKCVAVYYEAQPEPAEPEVEVTSVAFEGGNLVVKGTAANVETLDIYLNNTAAGIPEAGSNHVAATIEGEAFTATLPLDTLIGYGKQNTPFNLRYAVNGGSQQKIEQGSLDISSTLSYDGYDFRLEVNSGTGCVAVYYEAQPAPTEPAVDVTSVSFEGGEFVVSGTAANVETLDIYLINTNVEGSKTNFVTAELGEGGAFTVRLSLDTLISYNVGSNIPFNLRYIANGSGSTVNVGQGALSLSQEYLYGGKKFTLTTNSGCVAIKYADDGYDYNIENIAIEERDGKAVLVVEGSWDGGVAADSITLLLDKTSEPKEQITCLNQSAEAGRFEFVVDIGSLAASSEASTTSAHYFLRLYQDGTKYDVNSRWASDRLFEGVEIGDSTYCFTRNNNSAYYTLGVIRVENQA